MSQPTPAAGGYAVDVAAMQDAIRELDHAKAQLESIRDDARLLGHVQPPANDQVSLDAAKWLGSAAVGGPGSFVAAMDAGIHRFQELVDGLRAELAAYQRSEDAARSRITSVDRA